MWKTTLILKSGSPPVAFMHPLLTPSEVAKRIAAAHGLGGDVVFEGKTDMGGQVHIQIAAGQIEGWVCVEQSSGSIARPTRVM